MYCQNYALYPQWSQVQYTVDVTVDGKKYGRSAVQRYKRELFLNRIQIIIFYCGHSQSITNAERAGGGRGGQFDAREGGAPRPLTTDEKLQM